MDFDLAVFEDLEATASTSASRYDPERRLDVPLHVLQAEPHLAAAFHPQHAARFHAANPHATIELVAGASHQMHDEQPALVLDRIRTFVAACAGSSSAAPGDQRGR
jgi:pimeloyl-ACP methyl ester carboxylesterase